MGLFYFDYGIAAYNLFAQGDLHALGSTVTLVVVVMLLEEAFVFDLDFVQLGIGTVRIVVEHD